jgi:hypothetical protein
VRIVEYYSHLNGYEHILVHKKGMWEEIEDTIKGIDAKVHLTKISKEKTMMDKKLYNPKSLNIAFDEHLAGNGWKPSITNYWVTSDRELILKTLEMSADEQKREIEEAGKIPIRSYNQTDFVKDRVAIEVQFGKYSFVAYDLFVKHMAFFIGDVIDVGIEILPMKSMQSEMSSGPGYYEGELYNLLRQGRSTPAVPLVMVGIAP